MSTAVRRPFAAGVALLGASAIAISPVTPAPDLSLSAVNPPALYSAGVDLLASSDVLAIYQKVFADAGAGLNALIANAEPGQLLKQFIDNQIASATALATGLGGTAAGIADALKTEVPQLLQAAVTALAAGQLSEAFDNLVQIPLAVALPITDLVPAIQEVLTKPLKNIVNIVNAFTTDTLGTTLLLSGFIAPLISTPAAIVAAVQNVVGAFGTSPSAVVDALLTAPATIIDGFLNGGYGPDLGTLVSPGLPVKAGGLLSSAGLVFLPDGSFFVNTGGPLAAFQQLITKITDAITPTAPAAPATAVVPTTAVASLPAPASATVTLATAEAPAAPAPSESAGGATEDSPAAVEDSTEAESDAAGNDTEVDSIGKDSAGKDGAGHDSADKDGAGNDGAGNDGAVNDGAATDGSGKSDSGKADSGGDSRAPHKPRTARHDESDSHHEPKAGTDD